MRLRHLGRGLLATVAVVACHPAWAQAPAEPAPAAPPSAAPTTPAPATPPGSTALPPVVVDQPAPKPVQQAKPKPKPKPKPVQQAATPPPPPPPPAPPEPEVVEAPAAPVQANPVYGAAGSTGAAQRATEGPSTPINPRQLTPTNLEGFASAATNITPEALAEQRPRTTHDAFLQVPGMIIINDDANAHHGGVAVRGAPARRSRKILYMEDGHPLNLALWLDPSVHFAPPVHRLEGIEVVRGPVVTHGPNNIFGIVNLRNLSPFGPDETVVSGAIGWTEKNGGADLHGLQNERHVHTRQSIGNVGVVASYTGAAVDGGWDTERLNYNDFYAAIGWKGTNQDLVVNFSYGRQRDKYDESNLEGEDDDPPGLVEQRFFSLDHCKTCFAPGSVFNNYNGDVYRGQITHNLYIDPNTTLTTRLYAQKHRRDRYQIVTLEDNPADVEADEAGLSAVFDGDEVLVPEDSMFGRLRTFRHLGAESRIELANRPFLHGMTQDIQAGIRYEVQDMTNRNFLGLSGQVLGDGDKTGLTIFERNLDAEAFSAFLQSAIHLDRHWTVIPGVRLEWYKINRDSFVVAEEEGEAEEIEGDDCGAIAPGLDECLEIGGIERRAFSEGYDNTKLLPGLGFAYTGLFRSTVYGGYHRGMSTAVLRNEQFPAKDEIGDNFELGLRSTALMGLTFDIAGYYNLIQNYQFGQAFGTAGDRVFGRAEEVSIRGFEAYARLDSNPFHGGDWNLFGSVNYGFSRGIFEKGFAGGGGGDDDDEGEEVVEINLAGNRIPEAPSHVASLTVGVERKPLGGWAWDASVTATYRGEFFTDELNTGFGVDPEGENGLVPSVWLWSARASLQIADTDASIWVAGTNLTDELYISDREDGLKPGLARTFWTGFKVKF